MLGIATGCLEATLPYLHSRTQFNTPIASFQSVQHQIADMAMDVEAGKSNTTPPYIRIIEPLFSQRVCWCTTQRV